MTTPPSPLNELREWFTLGAVGASAVFAGLIWWLARRSLSSSYELYADGLTAHGDLRLKITITNRGDKEVLIEAIAVDDPLGIIIAPQNGFIGPSYAKPENPTAQNVACEIRVKPRETYSFGCALRREGGFLSVTTVSMRLYILKRFFVIRHKKKVLTAILPAKIRNAKG